jgi:NADPH:quinone reductase-like Zn-dependent oxidoreductase
LIGKPEKLTFEEAASVPVAALTALQGLRDKGRIQPGHKVLINGAGEVLVYGASFFEHLALALIDPAARVIEQ